ncbi:MAG: hypothetical protein JWQ35_991 [Bacteriovoracaceae bacterium]|nr:hypothetical protein [Bacteriovoracaceae bacterium]
MVHVIIHWLVSAVALIITAYLVRGFEVKNFFSAMMAAVVIGLANIFIWPVLIFLTLPLNILTLGLFTFVVNGIVLKICAALMPGFEIRSWGAAIFGALILAIVGTLLHTVLV